MVAFTISLSASISSSLPPAGISSSSPLSHMTPYGTAFYEILFHASAMEIPSRHPELHHINPGNRWFLWVSSADIGGSSCLFLPGNRGHAGSDEPGKSDSQSRVTDIKGKVGLYEWHTSPSERSVTFYDRGKVYQSFKPSHGPLSP